MEKEKLVFDANCNFNEITKRLINTINDKWFLAVFEIADNYKVSANILICIQNTLQEKYTGHEYLQISLATLESYDISENEIKDRKKKDVEQLNCLIEYSILQQ
ncbi:MAG: hypothetical protein K2L19_06010, partial [Eubacterium sp.]|nr:hypothetical protein [Eubacterium sp.]